MTDYKTESDVQPVKFTHYIPYQLYTEMVKATKSMEDKLSRTEGKRIPISLNKTINMAIQEFVTRRKSK